MEAEDDYGNDFIDLNTDVDNYYKASTYIKVGAEYRLTDNFSIRAGYSTKLRVRPTVCVIILNMFIQHICLRAMRLKIIFNT